MDKIGRYQITGNLGVGGFGRVYKALDPTVGRVVAIKVLNVQDDPGLIKRFLSEAKTSANLQHKNIVTVHEFAEDNGRHYLVMEYLSGKSLHDITKEGIVIPTLDRLMILSEVAQGLQYAHEHGVVHRDIKPANIMRLDDGGVKIMDFGIARWAAGINTRLTQSGYIVGTPQYMAPEQFTSNAADAQCDIWAYGVVLYEFVCGVNPFDAENAPKVIFRITSEDPRPISSQSAGIPPTLDAIVKRLLAKSRRERYVTMEEVLFDLDSVILELRRTHADAMVPNVERLIEEQQLPKALSVVKRILELDQGNTQARRWHKELTDRIRRQDLRKRIGSLQEEAEIAVSERSFDVAVQKLQEALNIDQSNAALQLRLEEVQGMKDRVSRAAALVSEAREELAHEALTAAFEHANEAAANDPANLEATHLVAVVRDAMERRGVEARRKAGLSKAKGFMLVQSYDGAVEILEELAALHPGDSEVQEKLYEARQLQADYAARQRVDTTIAESKDLIRRGAYAKAIELLKGVQGDPAQRKQANELIAYAREQLEADERSAQVDSLIREASEISGDFDRALRLLDRALSLSPGHERALKLQKSIWAARQDEEENRFVEASVQQCRVLMSSGSLNEALARARDLAQRHPKHSNIFDVVNDIERLIRAGAEQRRRDIETQVRLVERLLDQGGLNEAVSLLHSLKLQYPEEEAFVPLRTRAVAMENERRDREAVNQVLSRVRELASAKLWDAALNELDRGLAFRPNSAELLRERDQLKLRRLGEEAAALVRQKIAEHDYDAAVAAADSVLSHIPGDTAILEMRAQAHRQLDLKRLVRAADDALLTGDVDSAAKLISDLEKRFPGDVNVFRLRDGLDRRMKRRQDMDRVQQFRNRHEFDEARRVLERLIQEDPDSAALRMLLDTINREHDEYRRRQKVAEVRQRATDRFRRREFQGAIDLLEGAAREFPDEPELRGELQRAREARDQTTRQEQYATGRGEFEGLMRQGRFEEAVAKAQALLKDFPEDPILTQELQSATSAIALRDRRRHVEAEIDELEKLFRAGDASAVRARASQLLKQYQEPRAKELLDWANQTMAEAKSIRKEAAGPRPRWPWLAGAAAILVAVVVIVILRERKPPVAKIAVRPSELTFIYRRGDASLPAAASFQLAGHQGPASWVLDASDSWFKVDPTERTDDGPISVQVFPKDIAPGEYSSILTVASADGSATSAKVRVRLSVLPEERAAIQSDKTEKTDKPDKAGNKADKTDKTLIAAGGSGKTEKRIDQRASGAVTDAGHSAAGASSTSGPTGSSGPSAPDEPVVDCHSPTYYGTQSGRVDYFVVLGPQQEITMGRRNALIAGPRSTVKARGSAIPGCDVTVQSLTPGVEIVEPPSAQNRFSRITLKNWSQNPVSVVSFQWNVR